MDGKRKQKAIKVGAITTTALLVLVLMISIFVLGGAETYKEYFTDDVSGQDPSDSWYTYEETGSPTANVTDHVVISGNCYQFVDSNSGLGKFNFNVGQNLTNAEFYPVFDPSCKQADFYWMNNLSQIMQLGIDTPTARTGVDTVDTNGITSPANCMYGSRYNLPVEATIQSVVFYFKSGQAGHNAVMCIYDVDGGNNPTNLMWSSAVFEPSTSYGWYSKYPVDLVLPAGEYFIAFVSDYQWYTKFATVVRNDAYFATTAFMYPPQDPNPYNSANNRNISCYMDYYLSNSNLTVNNSDTGIPVAKGLTEWYTARSTFNYTTNEVYVTWYNYSGGGYDYAEWLGMTNPTDEMDALYFGTASDYANFYIDSIECDYWDDPPTVQDVVPVADAVDVWFNWTNEMVNLSYTVVDPDGDTVKSLMMVIPAGGGTTWTLGDATEWHASPYEVSGMKTLMRGEQYYYYINVKDNVSDSYASYPTTSDFFYGGHYVYNFTVANNSNVTLSDMTPSNGTVDVNISDRCGVVGGWVNLTTTIDDSDDDYINVKYTWWEEGDDPQAEASSLHVLTPYNFTGAVTYPTYNTTYYWYLNISDGAYRDVSNTTYTHYPTDDDIANGIGVVYDGSVNAYTFTTDAGDHPVVNWVNLVNGSEIANLSHLHTECYDFHYFDFMINVTNNESCESVTGIVYFNSTWTSNQWTTATPYSYNSNDFYSTNSTEMTHPFVYDDTVYWYTTLEDESGVYWYPENGTGILNDGHYCYEVSTPVNASPQITIDYPSDGATYTEWQWGDPNYADNNHELSIELVDDDQMQLDIYFYAPELDPSYYAHATGEQLDGYSACDFYSDGWIREGEYTLDLSDYIYFNNMNYSMKFVVWDNAHTSSPSIPKGETVTWVNFTIGEYEPDIWYYVGFRDIVPEHENWNEIDLVGRSATYDAISWSINSTGADDWTGTRLENILTYKTPDYNMSKIIGYSLKNLAWNSTFDYYDWLGDYEVIASWWDHSFYLGGNVVTRGVFDLYLGISTATVNVSDKDLLTAHTRMSTLYDDAIHLNFTLFNPHHPYTGTFISDNLLNESLFPDFDYGRYLVGIKVRFGTYPDGESPAGYEADAFDPEVTDWNTKLDNFEANSGFGSIRIIAGLLVVLVFALFPFLATKERHISSFMVGNQKMSSVGKKEVPQIIIIAFILMGTLMAFGMGLFPLWIFIPPTIVFAMVFAYKIINYAKERRSEGLA